MPLYRCWNHADAFLAKSAASQGRRAFLLRRRRIAILWLSLGVLAASCMPFASALPAFMIASGLHRDSQLHGAANGKLVALHALGDMETSRTDAEARKPGINFEDEDQRKQFAIIAFIALFWIFILRREVTKFEDALEQGPLATERFIGVFLLKALAGLALTVVQIYTFMAFPGPPRENDGLPTWEELTSTKSDFWKQPVAFSPQSLALAVAGWLVLLLAAATLMSKAVEVIKDLTVESLPLETSL